MSAPPSTPLMVAPSDAPNEMGKTFGSADLIGRLVKAQPRLFCPDANDRGHIDGWHGVTSIWFTKADGESRPICGIKLGLIPEWTRIDNKGVLITKGWRAIFDKVIKSGAVRRAVLERAFGVTLGEGEKDAGLCRTCIREGKRAPSNGGAALMCDVHDEVYRSVARAKFKAPEREERAVWTKEKVIVS